MMELIKKHWKKIAGVTVGAVGGYIYYVTIGCASGGCPITSSPIYSILVGAVVGYLLLSIIPCGCKCTKK